MSSSRTGSIRKGDLTCRGIRHNSPQRIVIRLSTESIELKGSLVPTPPTPILFHETLKSHIEIYAKRYREFKDANLEHLHILS